MITQSRITLKEQVPDLVDRFGRLLLEPPTREKPPIGRMLSCQSYETGWAASATNGGSCSIADYTDDFTYGTQSKILTVTAAAGGPTTATFTYVLDAAWPVCGGLGLHLEPADLSKVSSITVCLYENADGTNGYYRTIFSDSALPYNNYCLVSGDWRSAWPEQYRWANTLSPVYAGPIGSPTSWGTNFEDSDYPALRFDLKITVPAGKTTTILLGSVLTQKWPCGAFVFMCDDCTPTHLTEVAPRLAAYGWRAMVGLTVRYMYPFFHSWYNTVGMTTAQFSELYTDYLWDIASHGLTHYSTDGASDATLINECGKWRQYVEQYGWHRGKDFILSPNLRVDNASHNPVPILRKLGFRGSRACVTREANNLYHYDRGSFWIGSDPFNVPFSSFNNADWLSGNIQAQVMQAMVNRQVMGSMIHGVSNTLTGEAYMSANYFQEFCDWLREYEVAGRVKILTLADIHAMTYDLQVPHIEPMINAQ